MVLHNSRNKASASYEPQKLDENKACFAKKVEIPSKHEESRFEAVEYCNS